MAESGERARDRLTAAGSYRDAAVQHLTRELTDCGWQARAIQGFVGRLPPVPVEPSSAEVFPLERRRDRTLQEVMQRELASLVLETRLQLFNSKRVPFRAWAAARQWAEASAGRAPTIPAGAAGIARKLEAAVRRGGARVSVEFSVPVLELLPYPVPFHTSSPLALLARTAGAIVRRTYPGLAGSGTHSERLANRAAVAHVLLGEELLTAILLETTYLHPAESDPWGGGRREAATALYLPSNTVPSQREWKGIWRSVARTTTQGPRVGDGTKRALVLEAVTALGQPPGKRGRPARGGPAPYWARVMAWCNERLPAGERFTRPGDVASIYSKARSREARRPTR